MNKQYLWVEADLLYKRLVRLSTEAYQAYRQNTHNKIQAFYACRLGRLALRGGQRSLRRQQAVVEEQEQQIGTCKDDKDNLVRSHQSHR